jgi:2-methylisocitrate lyase-like PEP mutase family enzyme
MHTFTFTFAAQHGIDQPAYAGTTRRTRCRKKPFSSRRSPQEEAALDARPNPDFVIIARCDAYAVTGWDDTVRHCHAYIEAGADLVFVDGVKTLEDLRRYATDLADLPRMYNGDLAPTREVAALGYRLMICGSTIWLVYKPVREAFEELQRTDRVNPERYGTRWDAAGLLRLDHVYELERRYGVVETPSA